MAFIQKTFMELVLCARLHSGFWGKSWGPGLFSQMLHAGNFRLLLKGFFISMVLDLQWLLGNE